MKDEIRAGARKVHAAVAIDEETTNFVEFVTHWTKAPKSAYLLFRSYGNIPEGCARSGWLRSRSGEG